MEKKKNYNGRFDCKAQNGRIYEMECYFRIIVV